MEYIEYSKDSLDLFWEQALKLLPAAGYSEEVVDTFLSANIDMLVFILQIFNTMEGSPVRQKNPHSENYNEIRLSILDHLRSADRYTRIIIEADYLLSLYQPFFLVLFANPEFLEIPDTEPELGEHNDILTEYSMQGTDRPSLKSEASSEILDDTWCNVCEHMTEFTATSLQNLHKEQILRQLAKMRDLIDAMLATCDNIIDPHLQYYKPKGKALLIVAHYKCIAICVKNFLASYNKKLTSTVITNSAHEFLTIEASCFMRHSIQFVLIIQRFQNQELDEIERDDSLAYMLQGELNVDGADAEEKAAIASVIYAYEEHNAKTKALVAESQLLATEYDSLIAMQQDIIYGYKEILAELDKRDKLKQQLANELAKRSRRKRRQQQSSTSEGSLEDSSADTTTEAKTTAAVPVAENTSTVRRSTSISFTRILAKSRTPSSSCSSRGSHVGGLSAAKRGITYSEEFEYLLPAIHRSGSVSTTTVDTIGSAGTALTHISRAEKRLSVVINTLQRKSARYRSISKRGIESLPQDDQRSNSKTPLLKFTSFQVYRPGIVAPSKANNKNMLNLCVASFGFMFCCFPLINSRYNTLKVAKNFTNKEVFIFRVSVFAFIITIILLSIIAAALSKGSITPPLPPLQNYTTKSPLTSGPTLTIPGGTSQLPTSPQAVITHLRSTAPTTKSKPPTTQSAAHTTVAPTKKCCYIDYTNCHGSSGQIFTICNGQRRILDAGPETLASLVSGEPSYCTNSGLPATVHTNSAFDVTFFKLESTVSIEPKICADAT